MSGGYGSPQGGGGCGHGPMQPPGMSFNQQAQNLGAPQAPPPGYASQVTSPQPFSNYSPYGSTPYAGGGGYAGYSNAGFGGYGQGGFGQGFGGLGATQYPMPQQPGTRDFR